MRLLTKTTLYFLTAMILLLTAAGFYLFAQFSKELNDKNDRELIAAESEWIRYLETQVENGTTFILKSPDLAIYPVEAAVNDLPVVIDIFDYEEKINAKVDYRQLSQVVSVGGVTYRIMIKKSQQEKTAMVTDVTRIMLFVFAGLFASTLIFNWLMTKKLWRPFERSLRKIRSAELKKMEVVRFEHTNTREFNELNASLNYMTNRIYNDFVNMKEFTENAAHEMQTPLAVVQSKLELLLQDNNLTDDQVQSILQATTALTR
ncbi:MAG: histidine kinase dimerization/phospho-acceptor domain-containing protein, partial [Puia sp.]